MALPRRAFAAATAASVVAPTIARAKECPAAGMDWMTMSLEARNLAYFNVAHVGADFARQKTESWTAASKDLREQRPKHLDLVYGPGERTKWDLYPAHRLILCKPNLVGDSGINIVVCTNIGRSSQWERRGRIQVEVHCAQALDLRRTRLKDLNVLGTDSVVLFLRDILENETWIRSLCECRECREKPRRVGQAVMLRIWARGSGIALPSA